MNRSIRSSSYSLGFTLVEFAIVLTLFGLLVAGVIRGTELVASARVRNLIDQKTNVEMAITGFSSRYRATAGDLTVAQANFIAFPNTARWSTTGGNGWIDFATESTLVFQNLATTEFLNCPTCITVAGNDAVTIANSPLNVFKQPITFGLSTPARTGANWLDPLAMPARHILTTGMRLPSTLLREIDLKADDGAPATGLFRQSFTGGADNAATCAPAPVGGVNAWATPVQPNCAGAWLF